MTYTRNSHIPSPQFPFPIMRLPIQVQAILFKKTNGEIQYLLLKRISDTGGFWQPITGGIQKGETKTQALKREIQEETGIKNPTKIIKNVHYCEFRDYYKQENRQRLIKEHIFGVEIHANEKIAISREHTEYKWCSFEEALNLLKWKKNKEALKKLNKILSEHKQTHHAP
jgi:dATP pyrophosphohydrolase